jgi:hypothetical protein
MRPDGPDSGNDGGDAAMRCPPAGTPTIMIVHQHVVAVWSGVAVAAAARAGVGMSRGRRIVFALIAVALAAATAGVALLAIDAYLHRKFQRSAGFNVWGYRGPVASRKSRDEYRVVMLGGSAAYGYGTNWDEAIPAVLERSLAGRTVGPFRRFGVMNLAYNNEGAYSFKFTLNDYLSLNYDLAILYEGYNDLMGDPRAPNLSVFRHNSPVFRLTGYLPIFPMIFREKAAAMLTGTTASMYLNAPKTVFTPGLATKAAAEVLRGAAQVGESLEQQLGKVAAEPSRRVADPASTGCQSPWQEYCRSTMAAIDFALERGKQVVVATQPYGAGPTFRARHVEQQQEMRKMLQRRYGGDRRVLYVDLGDLIDLTDPALSFDQMHLTATGNSRAAGGFVQPVLEMAARRASER